MRYLWHLLYAACNLTSIVGLLYANGNRNDPVQIAVGVGVSVACLMLVSLFASIQERRMIREIIAGQTEIALRQLETHPTIPEIAVRLPMQERNQSLFHNSQFRSK